MLAAEKSVAVPHELMERVSDARRQSDALFNLVRENFLYERPIPERHRIIFYLGHLEAFDWNLLNGAFGLKNVHPEFDRLFAFGIDPVGGGLPSDLPSDWPAVDVVRDYVSNIRNSLDTKLDKVILEPHFRADNGFSLRTLLNVAIEHRLMHAETLSYMLHQLPLDTKVRPNAEQAASPNLAVLPVAHRMVSVPAGVVTLGLARDAKEFGWDNEYEAHKVEVPAFEVDQYKVTNRQYLEFMTASGYETRALWTDDDWNCKTAGGISHPLFWKTDGVHRWFYRAMFDEVPLDEAVLDWPVYVSQAEAAVYTRWAGKSLPTEAEWERAAYGTVDGNARDYPWGNETPNAEFNYECVKRFGNFDFQRWDPVAVNAFPEGQSAFGIYDMLGNGWAWTSTVFGPFPGFEPFPFYGGYYADVFDGRHFVMQGRSDRTAACMLRPAC